jgi:hypothetical protein
MPRFAARTMLVVAAACWLAGGPGGLVLRAALGCNHARMHGHHGHMGMDMGRGVHMSMPSDGPCFCSGMVGAFDQVVSVAIPSLPILALHTVIPIVTVVDSSRFPLPLSPVAVPETPPPNVAQA